VILSQSNIHNVLTAINFNLFVRFFHLILNSVTSPTFYNIYIKLPTQSSPLDPYISSNPKFYPCFKGALGALDGTHISAHPPASDRSCYCNCKSGVSQNVLTATTFNMQFFYILSGWEGSESDGGSFIIMHWFMIFRLQMASFTLQMLATPSVMCSWCHSEGFSITFGSGSLVLCGM